MRKIETLMNAAIGNNQDFKLDNTEVVACSNVSDVYLHGNLIARIGETWIELFDGGFQSNTTKSRLNAILKEHGVQGECVFQKNFKWFIHQFVGNAGTSPVFVEKDFISGMRLAQCTSLGTGTRGVEIPPNSFYITFVPERSTMYDELWSEIADAPGEIFDIPELRDLDDDEKFNVNDYLNSNIDY